jgi:hypothetical protein
MAMIVGGIMPAPVVVPVTIVSVVVIMPVIMIPVVIMPVVRPPGSPVPGIISPVPRRPPYHIPGMKDKPDHWPGGYIIIRGGNHIYIVPVDFPGIPRIGGFGIDRLNNVIWTV